MISTHATLISDSSCLFTNLVERTDRNQLQLVSPSLSYSIVFFNSLSMSISIGFFKISLLILIVPSLYGLDSSSDHHLSRSLLQIFVGFSLASINDRCHFNNMFHRFFSPVAIFTYLPIFAGFLNFSFTLVFHYY